MRERDGDLVRGDEGALSRGGSLSREGSVPVLFEVMSRGTILRERDGDLVRGDEGLSREGSVPSSALFGEEDVEGGLILGEGALLHGEGEPWLVTSSEL